MVEKGKEYELLALYVDDYYRGLIKTSKIGGNTFQYYKSLRGYFKHSHVLTDIKEQEFTVTDYKVWERILTKVKASHNPVESGGLFLKAKDFKDIASRRAFYATRKKLIDLGLLVATPFKYYFILNPTYVIKLYSPSQWPQKNKE